VFEDGPIRPLLAAARERVPAIELFDAHTHIGANDPDGFTCTREELLAGLAQAGDAHSAVFPMHEPDGYSAANDTVITAAAESGGVLSAYCRLDPRADPLGEAQRCLDAGAAGIKLHPRAEDFPLDTPELEPVFALADERGLPVLVHAGRGIPALGRHALAVTERHPGLRLILAHCGICDLAWIWEAAPDHPNLFFDTAWWAPTDLLALFAMVPPGQIVFASDAPYGTPAFAAALHLRYAIQAGLTDDQIRLVFGEQMRGILAGQKPVDAGPAPGAGALADDPLLDRLHTFLIAAIVLMFNGIEPTEQLALATLSCKVADDSAQAEVCAAVLDLIEARERAGRDGRPERFVPGMPMIVAAAGVARTPDVPLPGHS